MSAPLARNGISLAPNAWSIFDARAFTIGAREVIHAVKTFPTSNKVTGKCGVWAMTDEAFTRQAYWAAELINCPTCLAR